jgi:hypothetical protein
MSKTLPNVLIISLILLLWFAQIVAAEDNGVKVEGLNLGVAVMLLGSVSFMMGIFYLVNHSDKDMQLYTWQTICATISIFAAVLLFQAIDGVVNLVFLGEHASGFMKVAVATIHAVVWYAIMQTFLALVSGAVSFPCQTINSELQGEEAAKAQEQLLLNMKCWGILLGHITGFASIHGWAEVQQLDFIKNNAALCFLVPVVAAIALWCAYLILDRVRNKVSMSDDGRVDEFEKLWNEATAETEDDVMSLTVSFLLVQAVRFAVFGRLPNPEGELEDVHATDAQGVIMFVIGVLLGVTLFLRTAFLSCTLGRFTTWIRLIFDMAAAWAIMFAIETLLSIHGLGGSEMGALGEVIQATAVTIFSFTVIYFLDKEEDSLTARGSSNSKRIKRAVHSLIIALGVLVGFSWEKCFDVAVDQTADNLGGMPAPLVKLLMAATLCVIVVPAWRWYILPVVKDLGGFDEEEEEAKEECGYVPPLLATEGPPPAKYYRGYKDMALKAEWEAVRSELRASQARVKELEQTVVEQRKMEQQSRPRPTLPPPALLPHRSPIASVQPPPPRTAQLYSSSRIITNPASPPQASYFTNSGVRHAPVAVYSNPHPYVAR